MMVDQDLPMIYTKKTLINITPEEEIKESVIESNLDSDSIQK